MKSAGFVLFIDYGIPAYTAGFATNIRLSIQWAFSLSQPLAQHRRIFTKIPDFQQALAIQYITHSTINQHLLSCFVSKLIL